MSAVSCPKCKATLDVQRGNSTIEVSCDGCGHRFFIGPARKGSAGVVTEAPKGLYDHLTESEPESVKEIGRDGGSASQRKQSSKGQGRSAKPGNGATDVRQEGASKQPGNKDGKKEGTPEPAKGKGPSALTILVVALILIGLIVWLMPSSNENIKLEKGVGNSAPMEGLFENLHYIGALVGVQRIMNPDLSKRNVVAYLAAMLRHASKEEFDPATDNIVLMVNESTGQVFIANVDIQNEMAVIRNLHQGSANTTELTQEDWTFICHYYKEYFPLVKGKVDKATINALRKQLMKEYNVADPVGILKTLESIDRGEITLPPSVLHEVLSGEIRVNDKGEFDLPMAPVPSQLSPE